MKLLSLRLGNFMGAEDVTVQFDGLDTEVRGRNAAGKTTLAHAWFWLLFNKDFEGKADFNVQLLDTKTGEPFHHRDNWVEAVVDLQKDPFGDPYVVTLKKAKVEEWSRERGSTNQTLKGTVNNFWIDGVPRRKAEFDEFVATKFCPAQTLMALSSTTFFCQEMHWTERRKMLATMIGDVLDSDVVASDESLKDLPGILGQRSADDHKKMVAARRTEINKKINEITPRIDEASKALARLAKGDKLPTDKLESDLSTLQEKRASMVTTSGGRESQLAIEVGKKDAEIIAAANAYRKSLTAGYDQLVQAHRTAAGLLAEAESAHRRAVREKESVQGDVDRLQRERDELMAKYKEAKEREFTEPKAGPCPTCGRELPEEALASAREEAWRAFNMQKAIDAEDRLAEGKRKRIELDSAIAKLGAADEDVQTALKAVDTATEVERLARSSVNAATSPEPDFNQDPAWVKLTQEKADLEAQLKDAKAQDAPADTSEVDAQITAAKAALEDARRHNLEVDEAENTRNRIKELEVTEKTLAEEYSKLERELFLCEEFVRQKAKMITRRVNECFDRVSFKLFNDLINGGLEEVCVPTVDGVPWASLNTGARLSAGLDVIEVLGEQAGVRPPVFIDFGESITEIPSTTAQQIVLRHDPAEPVLVFNKIQR